MPVQPTDLEALFSAQGDAVYRYCLSVLRNHQDAQDAAQDTFLKAFRALSTFRGECGLKT